MRTVPLGQTEKLKWDFPHQKFTAYFLYVSRYRNPLKNLTRVKSSGKAKLIVYKDLKIYFIQLNWNSIKIIAKDSFVTKQFEISGIKDFSSVSNELKMNSVRLNPDFIPNISQKIPDFGMHKIFTPFRFFRLKLFNKKIILNNPSKINKKTLKLNIKSWNK